MERLATAAVKRKICGVHAHHLPGWPALRLIMPLPLPFLGILLSDKFRCRLGNACFQAVLVLGKAKRLPQWFTQCASAFQYHASDAFGARQGWPLGQVQERGRFSCFGVFAAVLKARGPKAKSRAAPPPGTVRAAPAGHAAKRKKKAWRYGLRAQALRLVYCSCTQCIDAGASAVSSDMLCYARESQQKRCYNARFRAFGSNA